MSKLDLEHPSLV
jgi:hypothetical protein